VTQLIEVPQAPLPAGEVPPFIVDTGLPWGEIAPAIAFVAFAIVAGLLLLPLVRAWARRIEARGADPAMLEEVSQLRERVHEFDAVSLRVQELEERLDFAERMLVKRDNVALLVREGMIDG